MRPKSMVLILIALACGLVASIGISQVVDKKNNEPEQAQTAPVYVASVDVPIHEQLSANTVRREEWPIDRIPPGAVTKLEDIDGRKPSAPLYKGEVILNARLVHPNSRVMTSARIPKGYRVVSVKVSMDSAVSGLLSPGDRVDVVGYFKRPSSTKTILTDVTVFAINNQISRSTGEDGESSINAKTVSLTVTPKQAQKLLLAAALGQIKLSLRNNEDDSSETPEKTSAEDLSPSSNNIFAGLSNVRLQAENNTQNGEPVTMEVFSPTTRQQFQWTDRNALPQEVGRLESTYVPSSITADENAGDVPVSTTAPTENDDATGFDFDSLAEEGADELQPAD